MLKSVWFPSGISETILHLSFPTWSLPYFCVGFRPINTLSTNANQQKIIRIRGEKRLNAGRAGYPGYDP